MAYKTLLQIPKITNDLIENNGLDLASACLYGILQDDSGSWDSYSFDMPCIAKYVSDYFNLPIVQMKSELGKADQLAKEFEAMKAGWNLDVSNTLAKVKDIERLEEVREVVEQIYSDIMLFSGDTEAGRAVLTRLTEVENKVKENSAALEKILNPEGDEPAMADDEFDETADIDAPSGMITLGTNNLTEGMTKVINSLYTTTNFSQDCIKFDSNGTSYCTSDGQLSDIYNPNKTSWWNDYVTCFDSNQEVEQASDLNTNDNQTMGIKGAINIYSGHLKYQCVQGYNEENEDGTPNTSSGVSKSKIKYMLSGEVVKNCIANFYLSRLCPTRYMKETKPLYCHLNINGNAVYSIRKDDYDIHSSNLVNQIGDIEYRYPMLYNAYSGYLSAGTKFSIQSTVTVDNYLQVAAAITKNLPELSADLSAHGFTGGNSHRMTAPFGYITTEELDLPIIYTYKLIYHFSDCNGDYFDPAPTIEYEYDVNDNNESYVSWPVGDELYNLSAYSYEETKEYKAGSSTFTINRPTNSTLVLRLNQILLYGESHSRWNDLTNDGWMDLREAAYLENPEGEEDPYGAFIKLNFKRMKNYVFDAPDYDQVKKNICYTVTSDKTIEVTLDKIVGNVVHVYLKYKRPEE